jgi:hypothetical protein
MASMANDDDSPMSMKEFCSAWVDVAGMGFQLAVWKITAHLPHGLKRAIVGTSAVALPRSIGVPLIRFLIRKQDLRDWTED